MKEIAQQFESFLRKMTEGGSTQVAVDNFRYYYTQLVEGYSGLLPSSSLSPVDDIVSLHDLKKPDEQEQDLLSQTLVVKLNGGLGTSMGLARAKSLLPAKADYTFLDIIIKQILSLRKKSGVDIPLLFMNSFRTDEDTLRVASKYQEFANGNRGLPLRFLQNRVPKVCAETLEPISWPSDPSLEWCPPGHGDIYTVFFESGILEQARSQGIRYAFISNADNLAAVLDTRILQYIAEEQIPFLMEVATRTVSDRKGGHLALQNDNQLVLREVAQCPDEDTDDFQDYTKYTFFNTNSLWIDLDALKHTLEENNNVLGLPLIRNKKCIDPCDPSSPRVYQLETAMGAAISVFPGARALHVPRSRFFPIKTTSDLLGLLSDDVEFNEETATLTATKKSDHIDIRLDPKYFSQITDFEERFPQGVPSLKDCSLFHIEGDFCFGKDIICLGEVKLVNKSGKQVLIADGTTLRGDNAFS